MPNSLTVAFSSAGATCRSQQRSVLLFTGLGDEYQLGFAKKHLDVLWHDYFKPEHLEQFPELHDTFWKATKQASKVKQTLDAGAARELLTMIDTIDEMWKATGGAEKTRVNGRPS